MWTHANGLAMNRVLVTGGAGFIGSNLVEALLAREGVEVLNVDKLVIPGTIATLQAFEANPAHRFVRLDLCDASVLARTVASFRPDVVFHLAAESHVDRSIDDPGAFVHSNVVGTFNLLEATRRYWRSLSPGDRNGFRFVHVSTDEVMGSLEPDDPPFTEASPYRPNSPYAASKASADHLARAWWHTYGLPIIVTNCSNNYGPRQYPEKLIPLAVTRALAGLEIPVYGDGSNVRDWIFVDDHVAALQRVATAGKTGATYVIGGGQERSNLELVETLCDLLDEMCPKASGSYRDQVRFVPDRPGHDYRYAIDSHRMEHELGWQPECRLAEGLRRTVRWYLDNAEWCRLVTAGHYEGERLGLPA